MTELKKAKAVTLQKFVDYYMNNDRGVDIHLNGVTFIEPDAIDCEMVCESVRLLIYYGSSYCATSVNDIHSLWYAFANNCDCIKKFE